MEILTIIGYALGVGGAVLILTSKVKSDNLADLKERVAILENEREELRNLLTAERETAQAQHISNQKAIAKLEGQVELYRDLQLKSIAETNKAILDTLKGSAKVAETAQADGGLLVKTKDSNPLIVKTKEEKPLDVKKPK